MEILSRSFDNDFEKIENIRWRPWVGSNYSTLSSENKILIVGESHYYDEIAEKAKSSDEREYTRDVVVEQAIDRDDKNIKMFANLHRALIGTNEFDANKLWNSISFYNFIQRPLQTVDDRNIFADDYKLAWKVFFDILDILQPSICIFVGVSAISNTWACFSIENKKIRVIEDLVYDFPIGDVKPRRITIQSTKTNQITDITAIRHTSQFFEWEEWHSYLQNKLENQINWLKLISNG